MCSLQLSAYRLASHSLTYNFNYNTHKRLKTLNMLASLETEAVSVSEPLQPSQKVIPNQKAEQEPPIVNFAFVHARHLLNCGGGGTCATCMVEVIQGKELLNPRTNKEKEKLKRNPRNWRLACQTTVGTHDSTGLVVIQQLPEGKGHEWKYEKISTSKLPQ